MSIQKAIHTVSRDLNLTCHCETSFYCTQCKLHIAELLKHGDKPCQLWCNKTEEFCDLPSGYKYWFLQSEQAKPLTNATSPTSLSALRLVFPLASKWKNLGSLLDIDKGTLDTIEHDYYKKADDCLREMLNIWLKKINPHPSWQMLADAVQPLDLAIAERIHSTYSTVALQKPSHSCSCAIM